MEELQLKSMGEKERRDSSKACWHGAVRAPCLEEEDEVEEVWIPLVIEIGERALDNKLKQGHGGHFACALHAGKLTWLDLARYVSEIGKRLASGRERWQTIRFHFKDGKRAGAICKDGK